MNMEKTNKETKQQLYLESEGKEKEFNGITVNGFAFLFLSLFLIIVGALLIWQGAEGLGSLPITAGVLLIVVALFLQLGDIKLEPNEARIMMFFGKYKGTFKRVGFYWVNPFINTKCLSLRARNLNADPIKVNDKQGNPVLIGLVVVWKLRDTYKAMFEIDAQTMATSPMGENVNSIMNAFENFVKIQSDAALRQVAGLYAYDSNDGNDELTLRGGGEEINAQLEHKLNERLSMAGIEVVEARINYLAYAPEIAAVMLRRQQADAVIAAREKIVEGAVSMVKMALEKLSDENVVELDEGMKAAMVSNLMVVLCGDDNPQPVVNTGLSNA